MRRVLNFTDMLVITGASIGPAFGLATIFGPMVAAGGSATPIALVLVTAIMLCIAAGYERLGRRYPSAGSAYVWVQRAFGPVAGAYAAWVLIVANILAIVAICVPAGTYTLDLIAPGLTNVPLADAGVGAVWVLGGGVLLMSGIEQAAGVTKVLWIAEMLILGAGAVAAVLHPVVAQATLTSPLPANPAFIAALVIGIWMVDGWEVSAATAEESVGAQTAGLGGIGGLLITAIVLMVCMLAFMRVGTPAGFGLHEGDALAYIALQLGGSVWERIIAATVLVSLAATLQATLVFLTRSFYAMGRDGILPAQLGTLDRRDQPARATLLITATGILFTLGTGVSPTLRAAFDFILSGTSAFLGLLFLMAAAAAIRLFARDAHHRITGVLLPAAGSAGLLFLFVSLCVQAESATRVFIAAAALLGVPLAFWRSGRRAMTHAQIK